MFCNELYRSAAENVEQGTSIRDYSCSLAVELVPVTKRTTKLHELHKTKTPRDVIIPMTANLVTQHFFAPANVGEIEKPDGSSIVASASCGAVLRLSLSVDEAQRITAAKFKVAGCSYLVAACSVLSTALSAKTTGEAAALCQTPEEVTALMLAGWPADKTDCLALACRGFVSAIRSYSDAVRDEWSGDDALICTCFGVSEREIESAIQAGGLRTIAEVTHASNAGAGCQSCYPLIEEILDQFAHEGAFDSPS